MLFISERIISKNFIKVSKIQKHSSSAVMLGKSLMARFKYGISHSIGKITSSLKTSWKGINLVVSFTVVVYAHRAKNSVKFKFDL